MSDSTRIADLRVSRLTIFFVRYVYPPVGAWALVQRRRHQRVVEKTAHELGSRCCARGRRSAAKLADGATPDVPDCRRHHREHRLRHLFGAQVALRAYDDA
jgi:hypothetical protein